MGRGMGGRYDLELGGLFAWFERQRDVYFDRDAVIENNPDKSGKEGLSVGPLRMLPQGGGKELDKPVREASGLKEDGHEGVDALEGLMSRKAAHVLKRFKERQ